MTTPTKFPFDPSDPRAADNRLSAGVPLSTAFANDDTRVGEDLFARVDAIPPPAGDPENLIKFYKESYPLQACISAMVANIATPGLAVESKIDLDDPDKKQEYRDAVNLAFFLGEDTFVEVGILEKLLGKGAKLPDLAELEDFAGNFEISDEDFDRLCKVLQKRQLVDRFKLKSFMEHCCPNESFTSLKKKTITDYEIHGYAFWEIVLDHWSGQKPTQINHLPASTIRLLPLQKEIVSVTNFIQEVPGMLKEKEQTVRFRLYCQKDQVTGTLVYYKTLGDPRIFSAFTGTQFDTLEDLEKAEKNSRPANAIIHFLQYDPDGVYGQPKWLSTLDNILGTQSSEKVNYEFFDNKTVPPGVIFISGGHMRDTDLRDIEKIWEDQVKGVDNFHKVKVFHIEPAQAGPMATSSAPVDVKFVSMPSPQDGQFLEYTNRNVDVIGMVFRLGRPVRGDMRELNKATAKVAVQLAEKQVFQPARNDFDDVLNKLLLPALGLHYIKIKSNPPDLTDPEEILKLLDIASKGGTLTLEEARHVQSGLIGRDFRKLDSELGKLPMRVILAGLKTDEDGKLVPIDPAQGKGPEGGENLGT